MARLPTLPKHHSDAHSTPRIQPSYNNFINASATQVQFVNAPKSKDARPFLYPVDIVAMNIPHYPEIITHPMDFSTIEEKLNSSNPVKPDQHSLGRSVLRRQLCSSSTSTPVSNRSICSSPPCVNLPSQTKPLPFHLPRNILPAKSPPLSGISTVQTHVVHLYHHRWCSHRPHYPWSLSPS